MTYPQGKDRKKEFAVKEKIYNSLCRHISDKLEPSIIKKIESSTLREVLWNVTDWIYNRGYSDRTSEWDCYLV